MSARPAILFISGSTRARSTNTAALRTACALAPEGVTVTIHGGLADLPASTPDGDDAPHPAVAGLQTALAGAGAFSARPSTRERFRAA